MLGALAGIFLVPAVSAPARGHAAVADAVEERQERAAARR
jgi:hypothetical protein